MKYLKQAIYTLFLNIVRKVPVGYTLDRRTKRISKSTTTTWRQARG